jgi:hypothetical protein
MNGFNKIDKIEFNDKGELIAVKGHIEPVKVIEINDMNKEFMSHNFNSETLKIMFWAQDEIELDYCGG